MLTKREEGFAVGMRRAASCGVDLAGVLRNLSESAAGSEQQQLSAVESLLPGLAGGSSSSSSGLDSSTKNPRSASVPPPIDDNIPPTKQAAALLANYHSLHDPNLAHYWHSPAVFAFLKSLGAVKENGAFIDMERFRSKVIVVSKDMQAAAKLQQAAIRDYKHRHHQAEVLRQRAVQQVAKAKRIEECKWESARVCCLWVLAGCENGGCVCVCVWWVQVLVASAHGCSFEIAINDVGTKLSATLLNRPKRRSRGFLLRGPVRSRRAQHESERRGKRVWLKQDHFCRSARRRSARSSVAIPQHSLAPKNRIQPGTAGDARGMRGVVGVRKFKA